MTYHLAQINLARLAFPLDDPRMEEFVRALEPINQIAELTPGFVWRLKSDDGRSATYAAHAFDPDIIVNYTVWASRESLRHFTYQSGHSAYFRRRLEWFVPLGRPTLAMWWVPTGTVPSLEEAKGRYDYLVEHGPSEHAFTLKEDFPPPA